MKFDKVDYLAFLCYLSFCFTVFSGGFKHSVLFGLMTFILFMFVLEAFFVLYLFIRKIIFLVYNKVVQPLHSALQEYREELNEIKKE